MKSLIKLTIFVVFIMFVFAGCAGKQVTFDPVDQNNMDLTKGRSLSASASGFQLLLFIPININDRHERAYQILRGQAGGDYITDIKVQESWSYAFIGTVYKTTISATAYPHK